MRDFLISFARIFNANRPIVFQYWDNDPPDEVISWMKTWEKVEPNFNLCRYNNDSALDLIRKEIGTEAATAYESCRPAAMRADIFRYCALYAFGGVYVDADTEYRGNLGELYRNCSRGVIIRRDNVPTSIKLTNSFMLIKNAKDPLLEFVIEEALHNVRTKKSEDVWDVTGPGILRRAYKQRRSELFDGFSVVDMYSAHFRRVVQFRQGTYKTGPKDWRRIQKAGLSIFIDPSPTTSVSPPGDTAS